MILFIEPEACVIVESGMDLSSEQTAELRGLAGSRDVPADVALRARIVLWSGEGRRRKDIAELAGVAPLTVDRCKARYNDDLFQRSQAQRWRAIYKAAFDQASGAEHADEVTKDFTYSRGEAEALIGIAASLLRAVPAPGL
ncbi:hypothetical protein ACFVYV_52765 [Streptomyces mirabilis]|uniref:hypothetical protein n=1 Tax=Streptomyces mirabilis TaxID=68239 RepID=UPI0036DD6423